MTVQLMLLVVVKVCVACCQTLGRSPLSWGRYGNACKQLASYCRRCARYRFAGKPFRRRLTLIQLLFTRHSQTFGDLLRFYHSNRYTRPSFFPNVYAVRNRIYFHVLIFFPPPRNSQLRRYYVVN